MAFRDLLSLGLDTYRGPAVYHSYRCSGPPSGTTAGVPGPRGNADDSDAGWFAPVATRVALFWSHCVVHGKSLRSRPYSVRWNSAIAMPSRAAPITATMPSDRPTGTAQPAQVTAGDSAALAAGETPR